MPFGHPEITFDLFHQLYKSCSNWGRWGETDERGTLNHITPDVIRNAATLVRTGKAISLQLPLDGNGPQTGAFGRVNPVHQMAATGTDHLARTQTYSNDPLGWGFADDSLFLFLQGGTQWDALGHIFRDGVMYNGFSAGEVTSTGAKKGDVENFPTVVSRGILLDIPKVKGRTHLEPGEAIYPEDLDEACEKHGVQVQRGDVVLIRTGDMQARKNLPAWGGYSAGDAPGLSLTCATWLHEREVAAIATDTWGAEVRPNELPETFQPLHLIMLVSMGLLVGEIWQLDDLAADCAEDGTYEFLFVGPPLRIPGAVGSPLNPQVIK
ncbi:cyclase family protein [Nocardia sp. NPDC058499]|uniref:cyclase family protein n=1 Tax=Nocardia sp. NPDC058499 TaxID=3346530 RepID=UPI003654DDBA